LQILEALSKPKVLTKTNFYLWLNFEGNWVQDKGGSFLLVFLLKMGVFEKWLGIHDYSVPLRNQRISINGEKWMYKELDTYDYIITPTKKYIIMNIAHLLQQNIEPSYTSTAEVIYKIGLDDKKTLLDLFWESKLIWPEKTYQLHNGKIRYSSGMNESKEADEEWRMIIRPSAEFITTDIEYFQPINKKFSRDHYYVYHQQHPIWNCMDIDEKPDPEEFKPLEESNYWSDGKKVFHRFHEVKGAKISSTHYEVINNEHMELLKDSLGQFFCWHNKLDIAHPESCAHVMDWFLFDWEYVYLVAWDSGSNLTRWYKLPLWEIVEKPNPESIKFKEKKLVDNTTTEWSLYRIGDMYFKYDGTNIQFLN
jgi:hypothetical protein